jgi:hypothetical protein
METLREICEQEEFCIREKVFEEGERNRSQRK